MTRLCSVPSVMAGGLLLLISLDCAAAFNLAPSLMLPNVPSMRRAVSALGGNRGWRMAASIPLGGASDFGTYTGTTTPARARASPLQAAPTISRADFESAELLRGAEQPATCPECFEPLPPNGKARFCSCCRAEFVPAKIRHWDQKAARVRQFRNKDLDLPSSCGVCSVLSALAMLGKVTKNTPDADELVKELIPLVKNRACDIAGTRCRHNTIDINSSCGVTLPELLVGRSECGSSGSKALIERVEEHFPDVVGAAVPIGNTLPIEDGVVLEWLAGWMSEGAAVCTTYNRQKVTTEEGLDVAIPDCWHAQAVFSVDLKDRMVGLTNPMKFMTEEEFVRYLPSEDTLLVRGNEVLMHTQGMSDGEIQRIKWPNTRWDDLEVSKQVLGLRSKFPGDAWTKAATEFVTIPYAGTGEGVGPCFRIFAKKGSKAGQRILAARGLFEEEEKSRTKADEEAAKEAELLAKAAELKAQKDAARAAKAAKSKELGQQAVEAADEERRRQTELRRKIEEDVRKGEEKKRAEKLQREKEAMAQIAADEKVEAEKEAKRLEMVRLKIEQDVQLGRKKMERDAERRREADARQAKEDAKIEADKEKQRLEMVRLKIEQDVQLGKKKMERDAERKREADARKAEADAEAKAQAKAEVKAEAKAEEEAKDEPALSWADGLRKQIEADLRSVRERIEDKGRTIVTGETELQRVERKVEEKSLSPEQEEALRKRAIKNEERRKLRQEKFDRMTRRVTDVVTVSGGARRRDRLNKVLRKLAVRAEKRLWRQQAEGKAEFRDVVAKLAARAEKKLGLQDEDDEAK